MANMKQCDRCRTVVKSSDTSGWCNATLKKFDSDHDYGRDSSVEVELCSSCSYQVRELLKPVPELLKPVPEQAKVR